MMPRYEILGELGRGGMGVVYQARHTKLNPLVALKMVLHGSHASASDLSRFLTEGEAVAQQQHPHIVQIYEAGQQAGLPFFCLEYVEGGTLDLHVNRSSLPPLCALAGMSTASTQQCILPTSQVYSFFNGCCPRADQYLLAFLPSAKR